MEASHLNEEYRKSIWGKYKITIQKQKDKFFKKLQNAKPKHYVNPYPGEDDGMDYYYKRMNEEKKISLDWIIGWYSEKQFNEEKRVNYWYGEFENNRAYDIVVSVTDLTFDSWNPPNNKYDDYICKGKIWLRFNQEVTINNKNFQGDYRKFIVL